MVASGSKPYVLFVFEHADTVWEASLVIFEDAGAAIRAAVVDADDLVIDVRILRQEAIQAAGEVLLHAVNGNNHGNRGPVFSKRRHGSSFDVPDDWNRKRH